MFRAKRQSAAKEVPQWRRDLESSPARDKANPEEYRSGSRSRSRSSFSRSRSRSEGAAADDDDDDVDLSRYDVGAVACDACRTDPCICGLTQPADAAAAPDEGWGPGDEFPTFEAMEQAEIDALKLPSAPTSRMAVAAARSCMATLAQEMERRSQREVARQVLLARQAEAASLARAAASAAAAATASPSSSGAAAEVAHASSGAAGADVAARASVEAARDRYAKGWASLSAWDETVAVGPAVPTRKLGFAEIPWPVLAAPAGGAGPLRLILDDLRQLIVPADAAGSAAARRSVQDELRRWHPDKFVARFGGVLLASEKDAVLEGVNLTSQCLTELLSQL